MSVLASTVPVNLRAALENSANSFDDDLSEDITYIQTQLGEENAGSSQFSLKQDGDRDWNQEFQQIREREFGSAGSENTQDIHLAESQRVIELKNLIQEFAATAKSIGTVIISELFVPYEQKSVKPITKSVGGIAGGEKYVLGGIFFKFAIDERGLYNGDEFIMKSAAHEFHSLMELLDTRVKDLYFPLMVLIDYLGYRLVAQSILPVGKDTLIWGTSDGAGSLMTVADSSVASKDVDFENKLAKVAKILNLQPHYVFNWSKSQRYKMYTAVDCEWHHGYDGRYYCVDSARLFPPATPIKGIKVQRPELVRNWRTPLCSDSFSGFFLEESDKKNFENAITEATNHLEKHVIPSIAAFLDQYQSSYETFGAERIDIMKMPTLPINAAQYNQKTFEEFTKLIASIHRKGINIRYLGNIRNHATDPKVRALLLTEIVARTVKNTIRGHMRSLRSSQFKDYLKLVVNYLNLLFGTKPKTEDYWKTKLKTNVLKRFELAFFEHELLNEFDIRTAIFGIPLLFRLLQNFSITLQEAFYRNMIISVNIDPMVDNRFTDHQRDNNKTASYTMVFSRKVKMTDFVSFTPVVKYFHRVELEEGMALARQASMELSGENSEQLLKLAEQKYEAALQIKPDDYRALCNWGQSLQSRGVREISLGNSDNSIQLFKQAAEKYSHAIEIDSNYFQAWLHWGTLLAAWSSAVKDEIEVTNLLNDACTKYENAEKVLSNQTGVDKLYFNWGMALLMTANSKIASMKKSAQNPYISSIEARILLENSCKKFEFSLKSQSNQPKALKLYALAVLKLARFHTDSSQMLQKLNLAASKFMECSELQFKDQIQDAEVYFHWGNVLFKISKLKKQNSSGIFSIESYDSINLCIDKYSFALMLKPDYREAIENLGKAFVARFQFNKSLNSSKTVTMSLEMYIETLGCFLIRTNNVEKFSSNWLGPIQVLLPASNSQIILRKLEELQDILKTVSSQQENSAVAIMQILELLISNNQHPESEVIQPAYSTFHSSNIRTDILSALKNNNNMNTSMSVPPFATSPVMDEQIKNNILKLMNQYKGNLSFSDTLNFDNMDLSENMQQHIHNQTFEIHGFTMVEAEPVIPSVRTPLVPLRPLNDDLPSNTGSLSPQSPLKPPAQDQGYLDD